MKKALVILGPTATGKTDLGLYLAKKFNGELVSCDSRQVYVGLDIGTGKMPSIDISHQSSAIRIKKEKRYWEIDGVKIWMYDVCDPKIQYTVFDYVKDAEKIIEDIIKRGKLPIIVGGTGLYLKGLLEGFSNMSIPVDKEFREVLEKLDKNRLQQKLKKISPAKWISLNESDQQNPRRLIRAIEIASSEFTPEESLRATIRGGFHSLKIGLTAPREVLYKKSDLRVLSRLKDGMVDEATRLNKNGLSFERMKKLGLEYGILADYLQGGIKNQEELIQVLQNKIHAYIRRQLTWFKKEEDVVWFDITGQDYLIRLEKEVCKWYYNNINEKKN